MDKVAAVHVGTLPVYTFVALAHAPDVSTDGRRFAVDIKAKVMRMDVKDLPTFSFLGQQQEDKSSNAEASGSKQSAAPGSSALGGDATAKNAPAPASTWKCDLCGLQSKGTDKCDICDAPKPKNAMATTSGSTSGFTGWGSTAKPPPATPSDGAWKCDLCGLMSKAGSLKCDVCEAPKPGAVPAATTASTGFTGWGAGVTIKKPKVAEQEGAWTCGTCGCVSSPGSVKCDVCETPK
jgi:rubrerythrin